MFEGDPKKAVYWYEQAAEQGGVDELGYAKKINNLGEVYWSGKNVEDLISMRASDVNKVYRVKQDGDAVGDARMKIVVQP